MEPRYTLYSGYCYQIPVPDIIPHVHPMIAVVKRFGAHHSRGACHPSQIEVWPAYRWHYCQVLFHPSHYLLDYSGIITVYRKEWKLCTFQELPNHVHFYGKRWHFGLIALTSLSFWVSPNLALFLHFYDYKSPFILTDLVLIILLIIITVSVLWYQLAIPRFKVTPVYGTLWSQEGKKVFPRKVCSHSRWSNILSIQPVMPFSRLEWLNASAIAML